MNLIGKYCKYFYNKLFIITDKLKMFSFLYIIIRWSNPILDRLTGGTCSSNSMNKNNSYLDGTLPVESLRTNNYCPRNESYYLATASFKDWDSPAFQQISSGDIQHSRTTTSPAALVNKNSNRNNHHSIIQTKNNNNVLIEDEMIENKPKSL